jgi:hypothetical protein
MKPAMNHSSSAMSSVTLSAEREEAEDHQLFFVTSYSDFDKLGKFHDRYSRLATILLLRVCHDTPMHWKLGISDGLFLLNSQYGSSLVRKTLPRRYTTK